MTLIHTAGGVADVIVGAPTGTAPNQQTTGSGTIASATYPAAARLTLAVGANGPATTDTNTPTFRVTSIGGTAALTWTKVIGNNTAIAGQGQPDAEIWTTVVPAGGVTGTVVVNMGGYTDVGFSSGVDEGMLTLSQWTSSLGAPTIGQTGSGSGTIESVAMSGLTVGSHLLAVADDYIPQTGSASYGTGQTEIQRVQQGAYYTAYCWKTTSTLSGSTFTMNLTAPTGQACNTVVVEIKDAVSIAGAATVAAAATLASSGSGGTSGSSGWGMPI